MSYLLNKLETPINGFDLLIKLSSFLLIYVTFFTTKIPFDPANYGDIFAEETTDIKNQIVYLYLFFSSLIVFAKRPNEIFTLLKSEKYLTIFVLICLISALWSEFSLLSFKRSFQLFVIFLVVIESILFLEPDSLLKQLKIVVSVYLFFNLFACLRIGAAIDPVFGTWRGIEVQKNHLAQTSLYCLLSSIVFFNLDKTRLAKQYDILLLAISVLLIYMARSSTAILVLAMIVFIGLIFSIESFFSNFGFGRTIMGLIFTFILISSFLFLFFSSEIFSLIPGYFGKDMTLSGRIPIWEHTWTEIQKHLILGYGFATYWIMGHPRLEIFADYFEGFKVNQAHNGFLEILLQLGIVGSIFFLFLMAAYIYRMIKMRSNLAILVFVAILTLNYTESALFKVGFGVTTFYFMASYTALSVIHFRLKEINLDENNHITNKWGKKI